MGRKEKTLLITIIANVILIALRFFLADLSGSVGLAANAWHSMTDAFVTSVVFIGLMIARYGAEKLRLASKKVEHILAIFVAVFIFYMGLEILSDALSGETTELRYVPFAAAGAFLGIGINYFMARYKIYVQAGAGVPRHRRYREIPQYAEGVSEQFLHLHGGHHKVPSAAGNAGQDPAYRQAVYRGLL